MKQLRIYKDLISMSKACADYIFNKINESVKTDQMIDIILSGGKTPLGCYNNLANLIKKNNFPVQKLKWFFTDERWVPINHSESNEGMIRSVLLDKINSPSSNILSWNACKKDIFKCAFDYNNLIIHYYFNRQKNPSILLLGMGEDGHVASLFPGGRILLRTGEFEEVSPTILHAASALYIEKMKKWRLSLFPSILNKSSLIIFLISGESKKNSFHKVLEGMENIPANWIKGKKIIYFLTRELVKMNDIEYDDNWPKLIDLLS